MEAPQKNKPAESFRLGKIRAAIWPHESQGKTWYSVTITREYKQDNELKDTTSFNRDDLPVVAQIANMAYAWIWNSGSAPTETE